MRWSSTRCGWTGAAVAGVLLPLIVWAAPNPKNGPQLMQQYGCLGCHKLNDKGGTLASDLTHIGKTWKLADLKQVIINPKSKTPDSKMPAAKDPSLKPAQIDDMAAYLASLK